MDKSIISKRLSEALNASGIGQRELSEKANITESSISHYINGRHAPSKESAEAMANVLKVNPAWLMGFDVPQQGKWEYAKEYTHLTNAVDSLFIARGWTQEELFGEDVLVDYIDGKPIYNPTCIGYKLTKEDISLTISYKEYLELKDAVSASFDAKFLEIAGRKFPASQEKQ